MLYRNSAVGWGDKDGKKHSCLGLPTDPAVKNLPCNAGDTHSIPDPGRSHMLQSN